MSKLDDLRRDAARHDMQSAETSISSIEKMTKEDRMALTRLHEAQWWAHRNDEGKPKEEA